MTEQNLLQIMLTQKLKDEGISIREAARRSGIANTTINRIIKGEAIDMPTLIKIGKWLDVPPSTLLNGLDEDNLAAKLSAMLRANPKLAKDFEEAIEKINIGEVEPEVINDIGSYIRFRVKSG